MSATPSTDTAAAAAANGVKTEDVKTEEEKVRQWTDSVRSICKLLMVYAFVRNAYFIHKYFYQVFETQQKVQHIKLIYCLNCSLVPNKSVYKLSLFLTSIRTVIVD